MLRVSAPHTGRDLGPSHFDELPAFGGERPDSAPPRRSRKVVEYFWIPTDQEWSNTTATYSATFHMDQRSDLQSKDSDSQS